MEAWHVILYTKNDYIYIQKIKMITWKKTLSNESHGECTFSLILDLKVECKKRMLAANIN